MCFISHYCVSCNGNSLKNQQCHQEHRTSHQNVTIPSIEGPLVKCQEIVLMTAQIEDNLHWWRECKIVSLFASDLRKTQQICSLITLIRQFNWMKCWTFSPNVIVKPKFLFCPKVSADTTVPWFSRFSDLPPFTVEYAKNACLARSQLNTRGSKSM